MSYDKAQFQDLIERTLFSFNLSGPAITRLLMMTAAHESKLGTYLKQVGGSALGTFQMERRTFEWLQAKYSSRFPSLEDRKFSELEWDLRLAIVFARLRYLAVSEPLPSPDAPDQAFARYWGKHYQTESDPEKMAAFVEDSRALLT